MWHYHMLIVYQVKKFTLTTSVSKESTKVREKLKACIYIALEQDKGRRYICLLKTVGCVQA